MRASSLVCSPPPPCCVLELRKAEIGSKLCPVSPYKGTNTIMTAPAMGLVYLPKVHIQIPLRWGLGCPHMSGRWGGSVHSNHHPAKCSSQKPGISLDTLLSVTASPCLSPHPCIILAAVSNDNLCYKPHGTRVTCSNPEPSKFQA